GGSPAQGGEGGVPGAPQGSVGCTTGGGLSEGEINLSIDGRERRYVLHLPSGYSADRPWPVVFALHSNGSNIDFWNEETGERALRSAVDGEAILVIAEAIEGNWRDYDA